MMDRRAALCLLAGAGPGVKAAFGQETGRRPVVGFLNTTAKQTFELYYKAFTDGLAEAGFFEGRTVSIEQRWGDGDYTRMPDLAVELVERRVDVIVATGGPSAVLAAKAATTRIPIVFVTGSDPVEGGLVESFAQPGGNLTGVTMMTVLLQAKRSGILREAVPQMRSLAVLINPTFPLAARQREEAAELAPLLGVTVHVFLAANDAEIDKAYANVTTARADAMIVASDPFFHSRRKRLVELAVAARLPAMYEFREFALAGGLMSYGSSLTRAYRDAGLYAARVLKGAKPAELPVQRSATFEFVVNLKAAAAIGLTIPPSILIRADEVIE